MLLGGQWSLSLRQGLSLDEDDICLSDKSLLIG